MLAANNIIGKKGEIETKLILEKPSYHNLYVGGHRAGSIALNQIIEFWTIAIRVSQETRDVFY